MRGKKVDKEFISSFIIDCVGKNKNTTEEFLKEAKAQIADIDAKIKEVESLKLIRTKLLDVVENFSTTLEVTTTIDDLEKLKYLSIPSPHICKFICDKIASGKDMIADFTSNAEFAENIVYFCVKELIENKIIERCGSHFTYGINFDKYLNSVFK